MKRTRERAGSRNRHTPLHCYFFVWASIPQGQTGCCRKALCDGISLPIFYVYVTIYVGMNKTAPRDASTISTTSIQPFMMYKT